ncbi:MAG: DUF4136 domain-containing protein [Sphingobium sp.]
MMTPRHALPLAFSLSAAALLLGGCTTAMAPVDVTRFHNAAVPRGEAVAIVPGEGVQPGGLEFRTYANAVSSALTRSGFTVVDSGSTAPITVTVDFESSINRPLDTRGKPVSVAVGGSTGGYGSGLGVGVGINLSGPPKAVIGSRLAVRMKRTATGEAVWEGRAETSAREGTPGAQRGIAAGKLADALFRDYPGQSGETITVK